MKSFLSHNWFRVCMLMVVAVLILVTLRNKIFVPEITAYPVLCHNDIPTVYDCVDALALNRTQYKVDTDAQEVISRMPGFESMTLINKYKNCVIINVKNWTCRYDDGSGEFGFNDGNYVRDSQDSYNSIYVTREQFEKADGVVDYLEQTR